MADEIKTPRDGIKAKLARKSVSVTVNTITPSVYLTGDYSATPEAKAKELTKLFKNLLASGVWESAEDAALDGVPAGTFIIVDDPKTQETDFTVEIVSYYRSAKDKAVEAKS
jgi:hypothetical protein